jgi:cyclophilin family peptidyl-prolyl cis-trans isomerase
MRPGCCTYGLDGAHGGIAVLRFLPLTLALVLLPALSPVGCPPTTIPEDLLPIDRGTLPVSAEAQPTSATVGTAVQLQASTSAGGTIAFHWAQIAGAGVPINGADQAAASILAPSVAADQALQFVVTATDESGNIGRTSVAVAIKADPNYGQASQNQSGRARADAGTDQSVLPGATVTLDGSLSVGASLTYAWRQVSGPSVTLTGATTSKPTFTAPTFDATNSVLLFELSVTDETGHVFTDRVQVTIKDPNATPPRVTIATSMGSIVVELNQDKAPITVRNFLRYVDDQFYDGLIIHRVVKDFVIQGGGFDPNLVLKQTRNPIVSESNNGLSNVRGAIAMARTSDPNSATSQFFIDLKNNTKGGDGTANLDPNGVDPVGYTVFGSVVSGMDIVDQIAAVTVQSRSGFDDVPVTDIMIQSIRRVQPQSSGIGH